MRVEETSICSKTAKEGLDQCCVHRAIVEQSLELAQVIEGLNEIIGS